jgi:hypothetical protein
MSVKLTAEASFDLDPNRKVWVTISGEVEDADDATILAPALAEAVVTQAVQAYAAAASRTPQISGKRPMASFQEDDD